MSVQGKTKKASNTGAIERPASLLGEVLEARERWLEIIKANSFDKKTYENKSSERGQKKTLYFIRPLKSWWPEIRKEYSELEKKLIELKAQGAPVTRQLWLPTVIKDAVQINFNIYEAKSDRGVSFETAKRFAKKAGLPKKKLDEMTENQEFRIVGSTGRKYKLSVTRDSGTESYPLTDWAICVCPGGVQPLIRSRQVKYAAAKDNSKKKICEHNKSTLFAKV